MTNEKHTPYKESDDHVPNPSYQTGVVDTTGTTGDLGGKIDTISPIFAQARRDALGNAADAIKDPDRDASEVVAFSDDGEKESREDQEKRVIQAAKDAENSSRINENQTEAQREAAKTGDEGTSAGNAGPSGTAKSSSPSKSTAAKGHSAAKK